MLERVFLEPHLPQRPVLVGKRKVCAVLPSQRRAEAVPAARGSKSGRP